MSTTCPNGTPWCTEHEHDAGQCVSRALTVEGGHVSVSLSQELPGIEPLGVDVRGLPATHESLASSVTAGPWELTTHELAGWLDGRNWSRETRRKVLMTFRVFYGWAVSERLCEWAPTAGLPASTPKRRGSKHRLHAPVWEEAIADFIDCGRSGNRTEGTLAIRSHWLGRLAEVSADPWAVTLQQLAAWLSCPDWAPETKRAARNSVRTFYRWAVLAGRIDVSPADRLDSVLVARALPCPAPDAALRQAPAAADDRQRVMLMLAAYAGLRRAEIANLHTSQISDTEVLVVGKGGH